MNDDQVRRPNDGYDVHTVIASVAKTAVHDRALPADAVARPVFRGSRFAIDDRP
jgi:hypothetical protein